MITVEEALSIINNISIKNKTKEVLLNHSLYYTLAEDIVTDRNYPPFNRSAMDGYAINIDDLNNDDNNFFTNEIVIAGSILNRNIKKKEAIKIMTGAPVPTGANAVVKIEDSISYDNNIIKFSNSDNITIWQNIAKEGEDILKNKVLIQKGTLIQKTMIPALASIGKSKLSVVQPPSVGIVCTGNEIINVENTPLEHQIRNSNLSTIHTFLNSYHIYNIQYSHTQDKKEDIKHTILQMLNNDIIIITGGVSMGDTDYVPEILESIGVKNLFYKVKMKPGKPIWFGIYKNKIPIFALPGNPVSVQVAIKVFIEPFFTKIFQTKYQKSKFCTIRYK